MIAINFHHGEQLNFPDVF